MYQYSLFLRRAGKSLHLLPALAVMREPGCHAQSGPTHGDVRTRIPRLSRPCSGEGSFQPIDPTRFDAMHNDV